MRICVNIDEEVKDGDLRHLLKTLEALDYDGVRIANVKVMQQEGPTLGDSWHPSYGSRCAVVGFKWDKRQNTSGEGYRATTPFATSAVFNLSGTPSYWRREFFEHMVFVEIHESYEKYRQGGDQVLLGMAHPGGNLCDPFVKATAE